MIRQIKFRGKRIDNGKWVQGFYAELPTEIESGGLPDNKKHFIFDLNRLNRPPVEVIPETVGQFTGLFDKSGKEIYEGDILEYEHREVRDYNVVTYKDWSFMLTHGDGGRFFPYNSKVIGNIHDNSGLLTTK